MGANLFLHACRFCPRKPSLFLDGSNKLHNSSPQFSISAPRNGFASRGEASWMDAPFAIEEIAWFGVWNYRDPTLRERHTRTITTMPPTSPTK